MKARVQMIIESEQGQFIVEEVASITRNLLSMESLGLSLAEGKKLLQALQASVVNQQVSDWLAERSENALGAEKVRTLQYDLNPQAEYILDWFHITMRLTVMRQMAKSLPPPQVQDGTDDALEYVRRIKWYLWHGNVYRALQAFDDLIYELEVVEPSDSERKILKDGILI